MTDRKFFKTEIKFTVLSEEPIPDGMELAAIAHQCIEGDWSMGNSRHTVKELDGGQAARALLNQGSDPSFFRLDEEGNDANND